MDTITPVMTAVSVPGTLSGPSIIDSLLNLIGERLSRSDCLRSVDSYKGFSARVIVELQLHDVDITPVNAEIQMGMINPAQPLERITLGESLAASEETESLLERTVDGSMPEPHSFTTKATKRWYTPRGSVPLGIRATK